ncbi:hypothetical protein LZ32DRAFT_600216, partial [Colletotrichum eremochloae]
MALIIFGSRGHPRFPGTSVCLPTNGQPIEKLPLFCTDYFSLRDQWLASVAGVEGRISQHNESVPLTLKLPTRDVVLVGASQMPKTTAVGLVLEHVILPAFECKSYLAISDFSRRSDMHIGVHDYGEEGWKQKIRICVATSNRFSGQPQEACTGNLGRNFCRID